jgi:hypothetical protein
MLATKKKGFIVISPVGSKNACRKNSRGPKIEK